jgi:hypothetical protein
VRDKQYVEWEGHIEQMGPETWRIDGIEVLRRGFSAAGVQLCAKVWVRAEKKSDGRLFLDQVRVLSAAPPPTFYDMRGRIEAMEADFWTVDGQRITIPRNVRISGEPAVGLIANIHIRQECGRKIAESITVEARTVDFSGTLEAFAATEWTVSGRPVTVVPGETEIRGEPWIGARVDVKAEVREDGSLVALVLVVHGAPPTATEPLGLPTGTPAVVEPAPTLAPEPSATAAMPVLP